MRALKLGYYLVFLCLDVSFCTKSINNLYWFMALIYLKNSQISWALDQKVFLPEPLYQSWYLHQQPWKTAHQPTGTFFFKAHKFSPQASHPILQGGGGTEEQTVHMQDWIQQPPTNYVDDSNEDQNVPLRSAPPFHASCLDLARVDRTPRGVKHRWLGAPRWASESLHGLSFWSWRSLNLRIQEILLLQGTPQRFWSLFVFF